MPARPRGRVGVVQPSAGIGAVAQERLAPIGLAGRVRTRQTALTANRARARIGTHHNSNAQNLEGGGRANLNRATPSATSYEHQVWLRRRVDNQDWQECQHHTAKRVNEKYRVRKHGIHKEGSFIV